MQIHLTDIISVPEKVCSYEGSFEKQEFSFYGETYEVKQENKFIITITNLGEDIVSIALDTKIPVILKCNRCLADVVKEFNINVDYQINAKTAKEAEQVGGLEENKDENAFSFVAFVKDCVLDTDMLILDALYTLIPMMVLCKEDCKGICKVCGINFNQNTCTCNQTVIDPRMAVFGDVFNDFKEV